MRVMIKNLLFLLATIGLVANISGCTSKSAQDETEIVENADVDKIDAESTALSGDEVAPVVSEDASLQAALGETSAPPPDGAAPSMDASLVTIAPPSDSVALDTPALDATSSPDIAAAPTLDESSLNDIPPPTDASVMALTETPMSSEGPITTDTATTEIAPTVEASSETASTDTALTETPMASNSYSSEPSPLADSNISTPSVSAKPAGSALKKVALTTPYQAASGGFVNTVYVARPGEKLKQISKTIFGADKSKELKKIAENSYLKSRSVKAGDKIYYVSPLRPDDSSKMLLYYEDVGMVPETYVAKSGDRLKKVSKELLGYDKAWVEMWTSNPVESKEKLAEGDTLRYWKSASSISTPAVSTTTLAANTPPPMDQGAANLVDQTQMPQATPPPPQPQPDMNQQMAQNTPPPPDMNSLPPPPPADMPPPPPSDPSMAAAGGMGEPPPPPPPPDMNQAPPPPPPPADQMADANAGGKKKFAPGAEEEPVVGGLDQDTMMSLGAVGVLTVALAFVLISRRRKKRAAEYGMSENNVGT